ncbi:hypothetical protein GQ457_08G034580 [Hibiscus cannabinus]
MKRFAEFSRDFVQKGELSRAELQPANVGLLVFPDFWYTHFPAERQVGFRKPKTMSDTQVRLLGNDLSCQHASSAASQHEGELFKSMEEVEAQTIGNLLPDEDDLFSGVIDGLGLNFHPNKGDESEDFDLFSSGGGMELKEDDRVSMVPRNSDIVRVLNGQWSSNGLIVGEHPSRTLFVRNIDSSVEDSELKALFEQYGDIQTLYTSCKLHGFVMVSYYDTRAAQNAMRALQNKLLNCRKLDIQYSIPKENQSEKDVNQRTVVVFNLDSSVSTDELQQIFCAFGEIKAIRETPHKHDHKFIEFYDVKAAEAAFHAMNRNDIAGKLFKLEPRRLWGVRSFLQQPELEQDKPNPCKSTFDELSSGNSVAPGKTASGCTSNGSTQVVAPFANQGVLNFHPHSLSECHDRLANGIPFNSHSTITVTSPMMTEGLDNRHIRGAKSNGHLSQPNARVFGSPGNGSLPLNGNHYMWNNSHSRQHDLPSAMVLPNSPSFVNGIHANHLPHIPAFPRAPPVMLNVGSPVHHHVGSAPPVNSAFWDRRHPYTGESPEASGFHLGSLGSMGFPSSLLSHPSEFASHNIFSHAGGNCMDLTKNGGVHSSQQMSHLFPGRNPNDCVRSFSYRRNESNSSNADKKQFELDLDRIIRGEDSRTTLMIKNIPNKYTSKMLLAAIDEHCRGTYDFIYLPIDFKNKCNVGYAFINMIDPQQIIPLYKAFNGKKWEKFNSEKVASIAYARIQGKAALITHFQNSSLMNEDKRCRPILFHTSGPNAGDQEPFPMGTNIRPRPRRPRTTGNDEKHQQGISSTLVNTEEFSNGADSLLGFSKDSD